MYFVPGLGPTQTRLYKQRRKKEGYSICELKMKNKGTDHLCRKCAAYLYLRFTDSKTVFLMKFLLKVALCFIHSFIHLFIHSFIRSFVCLFVCFFLSFYYITLKKTKKYLFFIFHIIEIVVLR